MCKKTSSEFNSWKFILAPLKQLPFSIRSLKSDATTIFRSLRWALQILNSGILHTFMDGTGSELEGALNESNVCVIVMDSLKHLLTFWLLLFVTSDFVEM